MGLAASMHALAESCSKSGYTEVDANRNRFLEEIFLSRSTMDGARFRMP